MSTRSRKKTLQAFEYQWKNIPLGTSLITDPEFREKASAYICSELARPVEWFKGKMVSDAGCGSGRWSYGFAQLGSEVVAFDMSPSGCKSTHENAGVVDVIRADIFYIPIRHKLFDIVFSWGVIHHTGDKLRAFESVAQMTKSGGLFHIYVYGQKSKRFVFWNRLISSLPVGAGRIAVKVLTGMGRLAPSLWRRIGFTHSEHTNFDAYAPKIADRTSLEEAFNWYETNGFVEIERCYCAWDPSRLSTDIYLQGISP